MLGLFGVFLWFGLAIVGDFGGINLLVVLIQSVGELFEILWILLSFLMQGLLVEWVTVASYIYKEKGGGCNVFSSGPQVCLRQC